MLWQLTFFTTPDASPVDGYEVGFFDSLDEVEAVKADYAALPGFRDAPEGTWTLVGHAVSIPVDGMLWQVVGYNWSGMSDERDLICSPIFADVTAAEACLEALKARYTREHLKIEPIRVNRRWWNQGFIWHETEPEA